MVRPLLRSTRRSAASLAVLAMLVVAGCAPDRTKSLDTLDAKGENAEQINTLAIPIYAAAVVVAVLVCLAVVFIVIKFRERGDDDEVPAQLHGNTKLEITWTMIPALILVAFAVPTVLLIQDLNAEATDTITVKVEGQQWWWQFTYDTDGDGEFGTEGDVVTAGELVIPSGKQINLTVTSNDVIHSFWIPELNGKRDAVPGLDSFWKVQANQPGTYLGQCTEFCGLSHANMRMLVRAKAPADFEAWLAAQQEEAAPVESLTPEQQKGAETFISLCSACHLVNGVNNEQYQNADSLVAGVAPNLTHLASRGTFAGAILNLHEVGEGGVGDPSKPIVTGDLEKWLRDPESVAPQAPDQGRGMPNLGLTEQQIDEIVSYLVTLE